MFKTITKTAFLVVAFSAILYGISQAGVENPATLYPEALVNGEVGLYTPNFPGMKYPTTTVITNLASGHGYTKQSAAGTQSDDTGDFVKGSQSLQLVTDGDNAAVFTRKSSISPTLDFSNDQVVFWVKVDDPDKVSEFWWYLSSDNFSSAWYVFKATNDISYIKANTWTPISFNFGDADVSGSPNRAAINAIQWRIRDDSSGAITANWGGMSTFHEPARGVASVTFDDGWATQFTAAKSYMDTYGYPGTAYVIPDLVGTSGYMTLAQLKELQNLHGWDIAAHGGTNLTTLSEAAAEQDILKVKQYLYKNGFSRGADHYAYPNGGFDEATVLPLVRKYFTSARSIVSMPETVPPSDPHRLRIFNVVQGSATTTVEAAIQEAFDNNEWLVLVFHKIEDSPDASTEVQTLKFQAIIDKLDSTGIEVRTVSDVFRDNS